MKQAMNEAWERALRLGIEYGYRAAERGEPLPEAIERALRATDGLKKCVQNHARPIR
jgi:hypothetical protein